MRTVFTNGSFDIIHAGHAKLLEYCGIVGDEVIVGLDSDARYEAERGEKPILPFDQRKQIIESMTGFTVYKISTLEHLMHYVKACDIYVKGEDAIGKPVQNILEAVAGPKMHYFPTDEKYTELQDSHNIKQEIANRYRDKC